MPHKKINLKLEKRELLQKELLFEPPLLVANMKMMK
jgi:hypothetical protein